MSEVQKHAHWNITWWNSCVSRAHFETLHGSSASRSPCFLRCCFFRLYRLLLWVFSLRLPFCWLTKRPLIFNYSPTETRRPANMQSETQFYAQIPFDWFRQMFMRKLFHCDMFENMKSLSLLAWTVPFIIKRMLEMGLVLLRCEQVVCAHTAPPPPQTIVPFGWVHCDSAYLMQNLTVQRQHVREQEDKGLTAAEAQLPHCNAHMLEWQLQSNWAGTEHIAVDMKGALEYWNIIIHLFDQYNNVIDRNNSYF